jgi:hypothetical protein
LTLPNVLTSGPRHYVPMDESGEIERVLMK